MDDKSDRVKSLEEELKDQQQKLYKAAELGKMLLDENEELKTKMDEIRKSADKKVELIEQERHTIQVKLEQKNSMEAWYNEEISHLKQQLADRNSNLQETLESEKQQEVNRLTRQIDELRADLDQAAVVESQLRQRMSETEDLLKERLNQTEADIGSRTFGTSEEVSILQEEVENLQLDVTSLKSQLIEKKSELNATVSEIENLRGRLVARDEELEDIKCQFTSVNNMLEQVRMEKLDLNCQLDALRMETSSHRKKGNSLFSELDDRRVEAESKLIALTVANQTLQEKYSVEKQQNNKYKRQISQLLLQMSSGRVDSEYVTNLESKLAQARNELKTLMEEKSQLLDKQTEMKLVSGLSNTDTEDQDYKEYLVTVIKGKEQELQKTKQELNHKNLLLLDQKSRTSSQDAKIVQLEAEKDRLRSHNMKLSVKLEELRLKYDPDSVKKSGVLVVKRTEKIPLDDQDEVNITETTLNDTAINQSQSVQKTSGENSQPLVEKVNNIQKTLTEPEKCTFSKYIKKKSVSISDDVTEHTIERESDQDRGSENEPDIKQKGRKLTTVKHISNVKPTMDVNECKSQ
ncbi:protein Spindly-like isoform X2 [Mercenaria mercenaria]|uniref:protein Spindly-like isoform X2 n=1 Tax=Mercenaria mercenaria TaxID=6596 RepID=UPI00234ED765|nr:protein Spindly-like isoform X2 [Mercenaria mercenaria]